MDYEMKQFDFIKVLEFLGVYDDNCGEVSYIRVGADLLIETYNGGWSKNETIDSDMHSLCRNYIVINNHPITLYRFANCYLVHILYPEKNIYLNLDLIQPELRNSYKRSVCFEDYDYKSYKFCEERRIKANDQSKTDNADEIQRT